jgi:nucleotide-binding universal stress UspA family protein
MARSTLFRNILVPHDFSDQATAALETAGRLAMEHDGKLTVLHVLVPFYLPADAPFGMPAPGDLISEHRHQLERLATKALGPNRPPLTVRVESGDASQRIIEAGRRADSIVMATSGRTGLAHFLIGSVAERVVRHATVPVLVLRVPSRKRRKGRRK